MSLIQTSRSVITASATGRTTGRHVMTLGEASAEEGWIHYTKLHKIFSSFLFSALWAHLDCKHSFIVFIQKCERLFKKLFCLCLAVWSHSDKFPSVSKSVFQSLSCVWALARVDKDSTADAFPSAKDKLGCTKLDWSILTRLKIQTNTNQGMWSCDQLNQKAN